MSDFGKGAWIRQGSEALFSRNIRKNTCSLVGGLIGFDYSLQGGRRNTDPKLMWGMSVKVRYVVEEALIEQLEDEIDLEAYYARKDEGLFSLEDVLADRR